MVLDERLCLVFEQSLSTFPAGYSNGDRPNPRHVMFLEFLDERGFRSSITDEERREGHLNVVVTERSQRAVGFHTAMRIGAEMARAGWTLDTFPSDELFVGKGRRALHDVPGARQVERRATRPPPA